MFAKHFLKYALTLIVITTMILAGCTPTTTETPSNAVEPTTAPAQSEESPTAETVAEPITLTFWKPSWGIDEQYLAPLFAEFEAAHPGVKIEYLFHPWEGLMERYTTAFIGDNPPDIFYLPDLNYPKFAEAGYIAKLDEKFPDEIPTLKENYIDKWWDAGVYKGHVYGLPYVHVGITIAYNKDLFDAAGVPYPPSVDDPNLSEWTWDKFVEVSQQLTDASKDQWGFAWAANWAGDSEVWMYCYQMQAGNHIANDTLTGVGFDNPNGLKAFEYVNDLANTYKVIPDGGMNPKFQDYFYTGKAAMAPFDVYQVIGIVNDYPDLNIGITPYPQGPGTDLLDGRGMHANVGFLYMSEKSKHPEMAFELMKFLNEKQNVEDYINAVGLFGTRKDYEMKIENPEAQQLAVEILEAANRYGFAHQISPKMIEVRSLYVAEVQNMLQGVKTPEQAWKDAVSSMNAMLQE